MQKITIDLISDWVSYLSTELTQFGYQVSQCPDIEVVHMYLNLLKRLVRPVPRRILKSKEFTCPPDLLQGLADIEQIITKGEDLSPYLSRLLKRQDYDDSLLNDWGIHHIHLGSEKDTDGFIRRTGPLLFCRFDIESAYFINVLSHASWTMQDMIKIIYKNWPESIEPYRMNGVTGLSRNITDDTVKKFRDANINTGIEVEPGVVYAPLGGGYSSSGISTEVVMQGNHCLRRLRDMQQAVIDNIDEISKSAQEQELNFPKEPHFRLEVRDEDIYAIEISCDYPVNLGPI